ncbi:MAG: hypothetical protein IJP89_02635 [Synergistaceae bacterium]|nr:hypothetical protein [Synergistaceae bacterium]
MRYSYYVTLNKVAGLIEILITCHPQGFGILLGINEPPTSREVHEIFGTLRDKMPDDYKPSMMNLTTEAERIVYDREYFDRLVDLGGGWPHINFVSKEYRDSDSRMWSVVMDHVRFVGNSVSRHASKLGYVAARYGLSPNTVMKYRREFPTNLAKMLLMPPSDSDDFYLLPG